MEFGKMRGSRLTKSCVFQNEKGQSRVRKISRGGEAWMHVDDNAYKYKGCAAWVVVDERAVD